MKNALIISNLILFSIIYAECYELSQAECLDWPDYCEWNDDTGQCQEIGGGTGGGTGGGSNFAGLFTPFARENMQNNKSTVIINKLKCMLILL